MLQDLPDQGPDSATDDASPRCRRTYRRTSGGRHRPERTKPMQGKAKLLVQRLREHPGMRWDDMGQLVYGG